MEHRPLCRNNEALCENTHQDSLPHVIILKYLYKYAIFSYETYVDSMKESILRQCSTSH